MEALMKILIKFRRKLRLNHNLIECGIQNMIKIFLQKYSIDQLI